MNSCCRLPSNHVFKRTVRTSPCRRIMALSAARPLNTKLGCRLRAAIVEHRTLRSFAPEKFQSKSGSAVSRRRATSSHSTFAARASARSRSRVARPRTSPSSARGSSAAERSRSAPRRASSPGSSGRRHQHFASSLGAPACTSARGRPNHVFQRTRADVAVSPYHCPVGRTCR